MRTNVMRAIVVATGLFVCGLAYAECIQQGCYDVYVDELYPESPGGAWIKTSGNETLANCTANSGVYLRLVGTAPGYKEIYATLLAAQLSEKKVNIRVNEGTNPCTIAYVTLNRNTW
jgi:hypothetical protein